MQISDREIRESLRLLSEEPIAPASKPAVDENISRMVLGQLQKLPDVRMEMVAPLRLAIKEHRYFVPEEKVAKMILGRSLADHVR